MQKVFVFSVICAVVIAADQQILAISNPHETHSKDTCMVQDQQCPLIGSIDLSNIILTPILTQPDTFMGIERKRIQGIEVVANFLKPQLSYFATAYFPISPIRRFRFFISRSQTASIPANFLSDLCE
jgi:hypothetical protein